MTKKEFQLLIKQFSDRKAKAIETRNKITHSPETYLADLGNRMYLQGGIDTIETIIESLEKRYKELMSY